MKDKRIIETFSKYWHHVGSNLRDEMYKEDYKYIKSMTMIDLSILQTLFDHPNIIFKEVCELLLIPKSTLTSAINRLEKQGFVTRRRSSVDKRQFHLHLTDLGLDAQREHLQSEYNVFQRLFEGLNEKDKELFVSLFEKGIERGNL